MIRGLYIAASGLAARQAEQENLSNDIANINTSGYKKSSLAMKSFDDIMLMSMEKYNNGNGYYKAIGKMDLGVGIDTSKVDLSSGSPVQTGRNLDFMIQGDGFFTVQDSAGAEKLTRDGKFVIGNDGYLQTAAGYKVLGSDHKPIKLDNKDFTVSENGTITSGKTSAKLLINKIVPNSQTAQNYVIKDAGNLYDYDKNKASVQVSSDSSVKQGFVEQSNVDAVDIMTKLITVMRSYESNQKVFQTVNEAVGKTVNEVGSVR